MLARSFRRTAAINQVQVVARSGFATSTMVRADDATTPKAGATATSKGFSKREKAAEDQYILERERERYQKAQTDLAKQKEELEKLEGEHKTK